jgi:hypothetical protein
MKREYRTIHRRLQSAAILAAVAVAAGCGGDSGETIPTGRASSLVLQPADLGERFSVFDEGPLAPADVADPQRFDRGGGWKTRYRRTDRAAQSGPLVIESRVDVFATGGGASRDLDAYRDELDDEVAGGAERLDLEERDVLGTTTAQNGLRSFRFVWRERNVTAALLVQGFDGRVTLPQAVALLTRQMRRIGRAESG